MVGVQEAYVAGHRRESRSGDSLKDLGDSLEEDDDSERGRGVVRGFTGFIQHHTAKICDNLVCLLGDLELTTALSKVGKLLIFWVCVGHRALMARQLTRCYQYVC